jgi:FAD/FMN-containing dehydrogenase
MTTAAPANLPQLARTLEGELHYDDLHRTLYATDASVYRALPAAVAIPRTEEDIRRLIHYARAHGSSLIPRAAGTSLAGQCVGEGIVVDISRHFREIVEWNAAEHWVSVQPGVVRDELNAFLEPYGYFFSPITSTANRAMLGGMVGNNASGTTSIEYGVTRDKVLELRVLLADGSEAVFGPLSAEDFAAKCELENLEGQLYRQIQTMLEDPATRADIAAHFPKANIHRRNTGYALDLLLDNAVFGDSSAPFNFCKLLCGSEGTLAFITEIKLRVDPLPPPVPVVVAAHFPSIDDSMRATQLAMQHAPSACELMDKIILDCTRDSITYRKNRFFIEGDPAAVLMVELRAADLAGARQRAERLVADLRAADLGYAYPIIAPERVAEVWALRAAGLGLLANIPGDAKAVACIEDTAVDLADLPTYIHEFSELMRGYEQEPVYYAHAGAGELHLRPILDLKQAKDQARFYEISRSVAELVKKYRGSLSGEHGDGRVRAAFIPLIVGEANYERFRAIKYGWDADNIFNPGKIVDAPPMNTSLRYAPDQETRQFETVFNFSETGGILRLAEKCNGSGDCRKLPLSGGTMCPSYRATRDEKDTTRARANVLREFLTHSEQANAFDHEEIKEAMDLCLSCKGCTSECPSNVDVATLKAEFLHQYYRSHGVPLRARLFAHIAVLNRWGSRWPAGLQLSAHHPLAGGLP